MIDCLLRKASPLFSMAEQSDAFKQLDAVGKSRYNEKLGMLGITTDPYMTPKDAWDYNPSRWPDVSFPDICVYFIHTPSPYVKSIQKYRGMGLFHCEICKRSWIAKHNATNVSSFCYGTRYICMFINCYLWYQMHSHFR